MSSMVKHLISAAAVILPFSAVYAQIETPPIIWQRGTGTDTAQGVAAPMTNISEGNIPAAIQRWKTLSASNNYSFGEYASFLIMYPDWPESDAMRKNAEQAINLNAYSPSQAVAYFDRLPPLTNGGRAKYALALDTTGDKVRAEQVAREA